MAEDNSKMKKFFFIVALFLISTGVFYYSAEIRAPWYGNLYENGHNWLSGSTIKFAENWYYEGPSNLYFGMLENPKSIEFPTLLSREPYPSYPPGCIIPIYIISKIESVPPNTYILMDYNLLNHFLIAFLISILIFIFLSRNLGFDLYFSFVFAVVPIFLELLWPAPLYWHQNVFFSDQAAILPFVSIIILEILRNDMPSKKLKYLTIIQCLLFFYGFLTDWFFVFIAATIYLKRIINGELNFKSKTNFFKKSVLFWTPLMTVIGLFISQMLLLGVLGVLKYKFLMRTGVSQLPSEKNVFDIFIGYFGNGYGQVSLIVMLVAVYLISLVVFYLVYNHYKNKPVDIKIKKIVCLLWITYLPCFLQFFLLKNHSIFHDFSILKFSIPLTISFVLVPLLFYFILLHIHKMDMNSKNGKIALILVFLVSFTLMTGSLSQVSNSNLKFFPKTSDYHDLGYEQLGTLIKEKTNYDDILFSPNFEILSNPPQKISYSMKRVYQINSPEDITKKVKNITGNYNVVLIFQGKPSQKWDALIENSTLIEKEGNLYFYRINYN